MRPLQRTIQRPISVVLALILFSVLGYLLYQNLFAVDPLQSRGAAIARVQTASGEVTLRAPQTPTAVKVATDSVLHSYDTFSTGPKSTAVLAFDLGGEISVGENVSLIAEVESGSAGRVSVTVISGEVTVTKPSENLRVFKNGVLLSSGAQANSGTDSIPVIAGANPSTAGNADEGLPENAPNVTVAGPDEIATPAPTPPKVLPQKTASDESGRLTNEEISRALASQGSRFQRCYLGFLQRRATDSTETTGKVVVSFELLADGEVRAAKIVSSPFNDPTLNSCLIEVINRSPFPTFTGEKIVVTEFPITLR